MKRAVLVSGGLGVLLAACGGGGGGGGGVGPSGCAIEVSTSINQPTTWANAKADCDVLVTQRIDVDSELTLQPGTVVKFANKAGLSVEKNGSVNAVGTAAAPIRLVGQNSTGGSWVGVYIDSNTAKNRFDYVTLSDAGSASGFGALYLWSGSRLQLSNSSVRNSADYGLVAQWADVSLDGFANNTFSGNAKTGVRVDANLAGRLDAASDYLGRNAPNTQPYLEIGGGTVKSPAAWPATDYLISDSVGVESDLSLSAGARLFFQEGETLEVDSNGSLSAVGTAEKRIVFTGTDPTPGFWGGLAFSSNSTKNRLEHAEVSFGGQPSDANVRLWSGSRLAVANGKLARSRGWGIWRSHSTEVLELDPATVFEANEQGDINPKN